MELRTLHNDPPLKRISVVLASFAAFYFSYVPFLYVLPYLPLSKDNVFIGLVFVTLASIVAVKLGEAITGRSLRKDNVAAMVLYVIFALYCLASYVTIGEHLNDTFTIRTLVAVNPVFIVFAISCQDNKKDFLWVLGVLSFSYFVLLVASIITGRVGIGVRGFQTIFFDLKTDSTGYQGINRYLGFFILFIIYITAGSTWRRKVLGLLLVGVTLLGMLNIGGRASLVALAVVLPIYFWKSNSFDLKRLKIPRHTGKLVLVVVTVFIVAIALFPESVDRLLSESVTIRRLSILLEGGDTSKRMFLFTSALELFLKDVQTMLFGAGINSFPVYIGEYSTGMYPHNILLELLCEYGLIGCILFLSPIVYVLAARKRQLGTLYGNSREENIVFLLFLYLSIIHMFTGGLRYSWLFVFITLLLLPSRQAKLKKRVKK